MTMFPKPPAIPARLRRRRPGNGLHCTVARCARWLCLIPLIASGCSVKDLATAERMSRGLVIVLPGIEGRSIYNYNVARGLADGGVPSGIEIYDWNVPVPGGALINLTAYDRNRQVAREIADRIARYQRSYPGRPVHLIGHSGGGGMAILALETMPRERPVTAAVLLAASVSPSHDLRRALRRTQYGIFNYYSPADIGFLTVGTSLFGNIDRGYGPAAGAVGFKTPKGISQSESASYQKLHQIKWTSQMARHGNSGSHTGWTSREFVRKYLAPLIADQQQSHRSDRRVDAAGPVDSSVLLLAAETD